MLFYFSVLYTKKIDVSHIGKFPFSSSVKYLFMSLKKKEWHCCSCGLHLYIKDNNIAVSCLLQIFSALSFVHFAIKF